MTPPPPKEVERDDLQDCLLGRHQSNIGKSSKRLSKFFEPNGYCQIYDDPS
jgi:hypothetical protein